MILFEQIGPPCQVQRLTDQGSVERLCSDLTGRDFKLTGTDAAAYDAYQTDPVSHSSLPHLTLYHHLASFYTSVELTALTSLS
jgi:hypothetical protein